MTSAGATRDDLRARLAEYDGRAVTILGEARAVSERARARDLAPQD